MCPNQLTASITAVAAILSEGRTVDQISLMAAVFTQLGDTLDTIAIQKELCEKNSSS